MLAAWALLVSMLLLSGCGDSTPVAPGHSDESRFPISTVPVERADVQETLETFGTLELDPERIHTVTAIRSGEVTSLDVVGGRVVEKGHPLLVLAAMPRGSPEVERAEIEVDFAKRDLDRVQRMVGLKLATNQELEAAQKALEASRAVLAALGRDGSSRLTVVAPSDGVVAELLVAEGGLVQPGQTLLRIAPIDSIAVRVGFEVEEISRLSEGLEVQIEPIFPGADGKPVSARLSRLHRVADPATQLIEGLVRIASPPAWAVAGTRARLQVILAHAKNVLRVPSDVLVSRSGDHASVFVIEQDHARLRPVEIGVEGGGFAEIRSGLEEGQRVALAGRSSLTDGVAVRVAD
jgi:RND family efflux transporter MFP subunit